VRLAGTTVSKASLHIRRRIDRKGILVGDTWCREGREIIPQVVRGGDVGPDRAETKFAFPKKLPDCGSPTKKEKDSPSDFCTPPRQCGGQLKRQLLQFARRDAMRLTGFGRRCRRAARGGSGGVAARPDRLTKEDLLRARPPEGAEGKKSKSEGKWADNLLADRGEQRTAGWPGCWRDGPSDGGRQHGRHPAQEFLDVDALMTPPKNGCCKWRESAGAGEGRSATLPARNHRNMIGRLQEYGLKLTEEKADVGRPRRAWPQDVRGDRDAGAGTSGARIED